MKTIEFWPDYSGALLWVGGVPVVLEEARLPPGLVWRALDWVAGYDDSKLPWESTRDDEWLSEGRQLFAELRSALLEQGIDLVPNEDFWATPE